MKYIFILTLSIFLFTGCSDFLTLNQDSVKIIQNDKNTGLYHEIETRLTSEDEVTTERIRLEKEGKFWISDKDILVYQYPMYHLEPRFIDCDEGRNNCVFNGLTAQKWFLPPEYTIGTCDNNDSCEVLNPRFPQNMLKTLDPDDLSLSIYGIKKDIYEIVSIREPNIVGIFKNGEKIFEHEMAFGSIWYINNANLFDDMPIFGFNEPVVESTGREDGVNRNIFYNGESFNQKYHILESYHPFLFRGKIGFLGVENKQVFVFFDGNKVSQGFDLIQTNTCCMMVAFPFEIYDSGILFFMGKRGEKYIFSEIHLDKFLDKQLQ